MFNVFVYCGGKCGGLTLFFTFLINDYQSIHTHSNNYYQETSGDKYTIFDNINLSSKNYEKIYIIDSYRTPIERSISSFFQNIELHLPNYKNLSIQEIMSIFNNHNLYKCEDYHPMNEVLTHYNIPLFDNFNFKKGYNIVEQDNKIFIKLLFKDINNWDKILSEIFGKNIIIHNENLSENKEYNDLYKKFKENYKIPKHYLLNELIYDREFKIYNTETEQSKYIEEWLKKSY